MSRDETSDGEAGEAITRKELEQGLRYTHMMAVQERLDHHRVAAELEVISSLLMERGLVSEEELHNRLIAEHERRLRDHEGAFPELAPASDKYAAKSPNIPCLELLPICKAACCKLEYVLSAQDLDQGIVRWNYAAPYRIRHGADGYCVHWTRGCQIYGDRPASCRQYDCRTDARIWKDFTARVVSDLVADLPNV